jgi:hypothetical protein
MWWVIVAVAVLLCFVAGIIPEDQGLSLARCWDRVRYSVSGPEWILAIVTGVFLVIILYVLNGMLRLLTLAVGTLTIVTGALAQWIGEMLPPYPMGSGKYREVEE